MSRAFTDRYGTELRVGGEATFAGCARLMVTRTCGVHIAAADFPDLIAVLYEAAELPAPFLLDRPEIDPREAKGVNVFTVDLDPDLSVRIGIGAAKGVPVAPSVARHLASVIAAYANAAEAAQGIDPAEIKELAEMMSAEMDLRERGQSGLYPVCARVALRWFRDKQQRGATP